MDIQKLEQNNFLHSSFAGEQEIKKVRFDTGSGRSGSDFTNVYLTGNNILNSAEENIAQNVNSYLESIQTDLKVEIHKETNKAIFKVVRKEDQKVIQEIPPKKMLEIEARIEEAIGSFINISG